MRTSKENKIKNSDADILKHFEKTFDAYNDGKMTKERMLKNCKMLYEKLSEQFLGTKKEIKKEGKLHELSVLRDEWNS